MIKCLYCDCVNRKDFGTCDFCGAPLQNDLDADSEKNRLRDEIDYQIFQLKLNARINENMRYYKKYIQKVKYERDE